MGTTTPSTRLSRGGSPKARAAHQRAESVGRTPQGTQRIYEIAADVFGDVTARGEGDPNKMSQILEAAERDPAAFLQSLPPEQRAAIQILDAEIARQGPEPAPPAP